MKSPTERRSVSRVRSAAAISFAVKRSPRSISSRMVSLYLGTMATDPVTVLVDERLSPQRFERLVGAVEARCRIVDHAAERFEDAALRVDDGEDARVERQAAEAHRPGDAAATEIAVQHRRRHPAIADSRRATSAALRASGPSGSAVPRPLAVPLPLWSSVTVAETGGAWHRRCPVGARHQAGFRGRAEADDAAECRGIAKRPAHVAAIGDRQHAHRPAPPRRRRCCHRTSSSNRAD